VALVTMWFDPICPWAWLTSRWLLEVERLREVQVQFRVMSLMVLEENHGGARDPAQMREAWGPVRVAIATDLAYGAQALRDLYSALGSLIHIGRAPIDRELYALAATRAGLPHTLANAAQTTVYDEAVRESHRARVGAIDGDIGCPVIHVPGEAGEPVAFFGPVVTPYPRGEAAGRLWDSVALAAGTDGFFELKRIRTRLPTFD